MLRGMNGARVVSVYNTRSCPYITRPPYMPAHSSTCVIKYEHLAVAEVRGSTRDKAKYVEGEERTLSQKNDSHLHQRLAAVKVIIRSDQCVLAIRLLKVSLNPSIERNTQEN